MSVSNEDFFRDFNKDFAQKWDAHQRDIQKRLDNIGKRLNKEKIKRALEDMKKAVKPNDLTFKSKPQEQVEQN